MYQHQVFYLFKRLDIDYYKFAEDVSYSETKNGKMYQYSDVANYIDIQLHLKHSQN